MSQGLLKNDNDDKPLVRKWFKEQRAKGLSDSEIMAVVDSIRLSSSDEWIIIETSTCVALIKAESKVGQEFWLLAQKFNGKARALIVVPDRNKLGFNVEMHEHDTGYWANYEGEVVYSKTKAKVKGSDFGISWEAMQKPVTPPSVNA